MKELVEYIAKSLVDDPENVNVNEIDGSNLTVLELKVSGGDTGKIIGKHGRMADALRTILSAVASKQSKRMVLEIIEEHPRQRGAQSAERSYHRNPRRIFDAIRGGGERSRIDIRPGQSGRQDTTYRKPVI